MKFVSNRLIEVNRELSSLDKFVLSFISILNDLNIQHVIVSGYVAILLGRSRVSEDVDLLVQRLTFDEFKRLHAATRIGNFYCLNAESVEEVYSCIDDYLAVRFAKEGTIIPNIKFKFAKNLVETHALKNRMTIMINEEHELYISPLELQIAFKESVLKSPKDLEDALHHREIARGFIEEEQIERYKVMLHELG